MADAPDLTLFHSKNLENRVAEIEGNVANLANCLPFSDYNTRVVARGFIIPANTTKTVTLQGHFGVLFVGRGNEKGIYFLPETNVAKIVESTYLTVSISGNTLSIKSTFSVTMYAILLNY